MKQPSVINPSVCSFTPSWWSRDHVAGTALNAPTSVPLLKHSLHKQQQELNPPPQLWRWSRCSLELSLSLSCCPAALNCWLGEAHQDVAVNHTRSDGWPSNPRASWMGCVGVRVRVVVVVEGGGVVICPPSERTRGHKHTHRWRAAEGAAVEMFSPLKLQDPLYCEAPCYSARQSAKLLENKIFNGFQHVKECCRMKTKRHAAGVRAKHSARESEEDPHTSAVNW